MKAIRAANRERILGAAEKVFARAGFGGATMEAIAEGAGLPKANLHYYFGSKHELYREVLAGTLRDWLVPMDSLVPEAGLVASRDSEARGSLSGSQWQALQRALDDPAAFNATLHQAAHMMAELKPQLRTLLHYHCGVTTLRTRQLMMDLQALGWI